MKTKKKEISYANVRKLKNLFTHRFQLSNEMRIDCDASKLFFDYFLRVYKKGIHGFVQDIKSNPFGFIMFSEIQVI